MTVLSVDLASRHYRDNGIALLRGRAGAVSCTLLPADALGLAGTPEPETFAAALDALARSEAAQLILLDGPQGWRAERSELVHQRRCERETLTPGKTGLPGVVKPATWTRMAEFSVRVFDALDARGWPRFSTAWTGERACIESFPTHAWRALGLTAMPGRANTPSLTPWREHLAALGVRDLPASATHDDIQAVVAGLAGLQLLQDGAAQVARHGCDPTYEAGHWREGWIVSPRPSPHAQCSDSA